MGAAGKRNALLVLILAAAAVAVVLAVAHPTSTHPLEVGDAAWDFNIPTLTADWLTLERHRGQVVVLNFWATWCPPCVEEAPSLERFAERMRSQDVAVLGVSVDQDETALRDFVGRYRISYPVGRDPDQRLAGRYGTYKFPETYILDRQGRVAEKIIGAIDWDDPRIAEFVEELAHAGERARAWPRLLSRRFRRSGSP